MPFNPRQPAAQSAANFQDQARRSPYRLRRPGRRPARQMSHKASGTESISPMPTTKPSVVGGGPGSIAKNSIPQK